VKRDRWKVIPIPDIVIKIMNELAEHDSPDRRVTRDPTFRIGAEIIEDTNDPLEDADGNDSDGADEELGGDKTQEPLVIKIPRQIWRDEA
jgi:hypothetical protein